MDYGHPEIMSWRPWLALYLLALGGLLIQQARAHAKFFSAALSARFGPALSPWRLALKWALLAAAGFSLLKALAVPLGEPIKVESAATGADIILAVDVSSSMYAQDIQPNRLLALKSALGAFLGRLGGDRVGVVAFAGEAVVACPLTTDYDTAALFLEKLESDSVPKDGTGLGPALKLCLDAFAADPKRGRMVVLASDGEDTLDSGAEKEARRAAELGVPVYTLGIGTPQGGMIPGRPDMFGRVMAKVYKGQPVVSRLNPEPLRLMASLSGGEYFAGGSASAIQAAYLRARELKQGMAQTQDRWTRDPLYQGPLKLAFWLLLLEMMVSARSGGWRRAAGKAWAWWRGLRSRRAAAAGWLALTLLPGSLKALDLSFDPGRKEYNQGNQAFRRGDYQAALEFYKKSADLNPNRPELDYNAGCALDKLGDPEGAAGAFEDALEGKPQDEEARINLERTLRKIPTPPPSQGGGGGGGSQGQREKGAWRKRGGQQPQPGQQGQPGQGGQGGQGQPGAGQGSRQAGGMKPGQGKGRAPGPGGSQGGALSEDEIHAMMNMLKNDQRRYGDAFQPLQKRQEQQSQDPFEELFEQMTGRKIRQPKQGDGGGGDRKDW